ncbi:Vacuolar protein sorting-associated protein 70 [Coemansia erecta]|nr:Vacuolar protein sorting-associated protein 70 [Coemansia erecta]
MFYDEKELLNGDAAATAAAEKRPQQLRPGLFGRATRLRRRTVAVLLSITALVVVLVAPALLPRAPDVSDTDDLRANADGRIDIARLFFNALSVDRLRSNLAYYTSGTHAAGANKTQAAHTLEYFQQQGFDSEIVQYFPWLNRPLTQRVTMFNSTTHKMVYEAQLKEDTVPGDPASDDPNNLAAFHGYSSDGNVTGQLVYANYGSADDFSALKQAGVSVKHAVVIVRYGKVHSSVKVHAAELAGARGVLIYSDPGDDGYARGKDYPAGPWRPESSIRRDTVLRHRIHPGDPLTPGYPATKNAQRIEPGDAANLSRIPSLPLSYRDALPLLSAIQSHGVAAGSISDSWVGGLTSKGIEYWTGPSKLEVNLENRVEYRTVPIQNVIGRIKGWEDPGQAVIIGNHRDAWSAGASDPSSGAAVLLELARAFGELRKLGWRPRRTIVLASWDAAEYGSIGSTEWVEENIDWLRASAVAYVNVGAAVGGDIFGVAASPILRELLYAVAKQVPYPRTNETVYDAWLRQSSAEALDADAGADASSKPRPAVSPFGLGGDTVAFAMHAGISSVDMGFVGSGGARHSNFDSFKRMVTYIDSDMQLHLAIARLWGLLAIRLADDPVLDMCPVCYAKDVKRFVRQFEKQMRQHGAVLAADVEGMAVADMEGMSVADMEGMSVAKKLRRLHAAQRQLETNARIVEHDKRHLRSVYGEECQMTGRRRHMSCLALRTSINERMFALERHFIDPSGVPSREWYKHALFGPGRWADAGYQPFPALAAALATGDKSCVRQCEKSIADIIHEAAWFLREA